MISTIVVQSSTPDVPTASPLTYVVIFLGAALLAQRFTDTDLLGWIPTVGSSSGGDANPVQRLPGAGSGPGFGLTRPRTLMIAIFGSLAVAIMAGAAGLPSEARVPVAATLTLTATYLALRALGSYSFSVFAFVGASVLILGLSALGEPLIGAIVNSRVFPVIAIGGLYLGYKAVQQLGNDEPRRVYIRRRNE